MTRKHYVILADKLGVALALAIHGGQHANFYNDVYVPIVDMLASDNPRFDRGRFAYAVAQSEEAYRALARLEYNSDNPSIEDTKSL